MSVVYLLHFERPIAEGHPCQHYIGFANVLESRIAHHRKGTSGVRLLEVAKERGIGFEVARVWEDGSKELEKKLKRQKRGTRLCPICNQRRMSVAVNFTDEQLSILLEEIEKEDEPIIPFTDEEVAEIESLPPVPISPDREEAMRQTFEEMRQEYIRGLSPG